MRGKSRLLPALVSTGIWAVSHAQSTSSVDEAAEVVEVTATRISRSGFTAPTPTTTTGAKDREMRASTTVANLLNELPSA